MQSKALRPDQLQRLLTVLDTDYQQLINSYRSPWRSESDREECRRILVGSISNARDATESLQGTRDPELRPLVSNLIVQVELADDACKHPSTLQW